PITSVPPPKPTEPEEDWRLVLNHLRRQAAQPPQALSVPSPVRSVESAPSVVEAPPKVNVTIDRGAAYLKRMLADTHISTVGTVALAGLTLLECGVTAKDPVFQSVVERVRTEAPPLTTTYEIAVCIWFLD